MLGNVVVQMSAVEGVSAGAAPNARNIFFRCFGFLRSDSNGRSFDESFPFSLNVAVVALPPYRWRFVAILSTPPLFRRSLNRLAPWAPFTRGPGHAISFAAHFEPHLGERLLRILERFGTTRMTRSSDRTQQDVIRASEVSSLSATHIRDGGTAH